MSSLFGTIQLANNALQANQIGLQVVSQNIANANTPGYSREEVNFIPAATQRSGDVLLGLGVQVNGVVQRIDSFLEDRLRGAASDRNNHETQAAIYQELESLLGALSDGNLAGSINRFISSVSDILNQPESVSARNLATLHGRTLAQDIRNLAGRVGDIRTNINDQIRGAVDDANRLIEEIRKLNVRISNLEGGSVSNSDAVGLRDLRNVAMGKLAELISIDVNEQESSSTNIFNNGEFLVFEGTSRQLSVVQTVTDGVTKVEVVFTDTQSPLGESSGKLSGLLAARDDILGAFQSRLDEFASGFVLEFNKIFSSGQGIKGYSSLTSSFRVNDVAGSLESVGLPFTPVSGGFDVLVRNTQTGLTTTTRVNVDLNGLNGNDTTQESLRDALDAIDGLAASITPEGKLSLTRESALSEFAFANDTSGVLASLGVATFFTGSTALDLGVQQAIIDDPKKFAASKNGIGVDTEIGVALAGFLERPLDSFNGETLTQRGDRLFAEVSEAAAATKAVAEGYASFEGSLQGQQLAISGVNLDEEAVKMMSYQRAFQAAARFISEINDLLEYLIQL